MKNFKSFEKEMLSAKSMLTVKGGAGYELFQEVDASGKTVYYTLAIDAKGNSYKVYQEKIQLGNATLDNNWA